MAEARTAWLASMALTGLSQGRMVFNLPSRGWTVNEIPSTPWASGSRRIDVVRSRSTRITGKERPLRLPLATGRAPRSAPARRAAAQS